jgi:hypothetical protein
MIQLCGCKIQSSMQVHKLLVESSLSKRLQVNSRNISATQGHRRVCMAICISWCAVVLYSPWELCVRKFIISENQICFRSNKLTYTIIKKSFKMMYSVSLHPSCCASPSPQRCGWSLGYLQFHKNKFCIVCFILFSVCVIMLYTAGFKSGLMTSCVNNEPSVAFVCCM